MIIMIFTSFNWIFNKKECISHAITHVFKLNLHCHVKNYLHDVNTTNLGRGSK